MSPARRWTSRVGAEPFVYRRAGRNTTTLYVVVGVWFGLCALVILVDAAAWLMGLIGLATLPAIWDLWKNPQSGLSLSGGTLDWFTGKRDGDIKLSQIDHVRLDTQLDFSVRATVVLHNQQKIRLPFECTPPHKDFEAALEAHGVRTRRHHFSLVG